MTPETSQHYCPPREAALFKGRFSSRMRELVMGSSRRDALAALRRARLDEWKISGDGHEIEVKVGPTTIQFTPTTKSVAWISANTPHGAFRLPREHWISAQISRRFERRLAGYRHALQTDAEAQLAELCHAVQSGRICD